MIFIKKKPETQLNPFGKIKDESFNFDWIKKYFDKKDKTDAYHVITNKTCNDMDFEELFMFIDRTGSKVGQQFLYNKLRTISKNSSFPNENLVKQFSDHPEFRILVQKQLKKLKSEDAYFITTLFQDEYILPPKWFFIINILSFTSLISILLFPFAPQMLFVLFGVFLINMVIHYWNKRNLYQYLGSIPQLLRLTKVVSELYKNDPLKPLNPDLPNSIRKMDEIKNRMSYFRMETQSEGDYEAFIRGILEFIKIIFLLEPLLLFGVLRRLDKLRKEIEDLFVFAGETDALISIASLRNGLKSFCIPEISDSPKHISFLEAYHPLIIDCVANSIQSKEKSVLLTGSNMSGKTSFIRTIGINAITALTLNTCFAKQFAMPKMRMYSAIRISDDLLNDKSYYFEEVLTIKEMVDQSEGAVPNLFLLDEIFKGTNTVERISAGKAVLSSLSKNSNMVFVSTHDIELADMLIDEFELYHFSEQVDNKSVDFDYKLKSGKLKNRNAIRILQINDYPETIINEAIEIAKTLDSISRKS